MAAAALVLYVLLLFLVFAVHSWRQHRATGSSGFRGISGRPGTVEWLGGVLFVVALVLGTLAPLADLLGLLDPVAALDHRGIQIVGLLVAVLGGILTIVSQEAMGRSWRIGVDEREHTDLVTSGAFALVRNPFFSALTVAALGLLIMVPNVLAFLALAALIAAAEIQVRLVEEPALLRTHGEGYAQYAQRVGRFAPGLGRRLTSRAQPRLPA